MSIKKVVIGIDPGVTGAIGVLDSSTGNALDVVDVPVVKVKRKELLLPSYYKLLSDFKIRLAVVEKVTATATGGVASAFTFGGTYVAPQCFLTALDVPFDLVSPQVWKKHFNLINKDKDASRKEAMQLFPNMEKALRRKSDHNRADALLLARFIWEKYKNVLSPGARRVRVDG